jgi:cystathionine gamma-synthase
MSSPTSPDHSLDALSLESRVVAAARPARESDAGTNLPIELNSTFLAPGATGYGRFGNKTWSALESAIESLEGGATLAFSSGVAAISALFSLIPRGAVITASRNGYSGSMVILRQLEASGAAEVRYVDVADTAQVLAALPGTTLLWLESPTNPALEVADMPTIIAAAKSHNVGVAVDNTFATPLIQQPLEMGADVVVHSLTKYIAGHSDVILGSISTKDPALYQRLADVRRINGSIPGPFEVWLALRGLRTLGVRLERAQKNAMELATRLSTHPAVSLVRYPGLPTDPHHEIAKSFMKGFGAIISFDHKAGAQAADRACAASELVAHATSLGGVESLWERRHRWSAESPTIPTNLIRLSVGIEDVEDIWRDIDQALHASLES